MVKDSDLKDIAYKIATAHNLTKTFSYKQFQHIKCKNHAWAPFEHWTESEYSSHIAGIGDAIYYALKNIAEKVKD